MKKLLIVLLAAMLAVLPMMAFATDSRSNQDIPETKVLDTEPENEDEEVIPPEVEVVPDTPEVQNLQEDMQTIFRLTIRYIFVSGETAAPSYDETLQAGTEFSIPSPEISGYTTVTPLVSGVMPKRDVVLTVVYLGEEDEVSAFQISRMQSLASIDEYEVPLGLGFTMPNLGFTFE